MEWGNALLLDILQDKKIKTALVFTRTKHGADKIVKVLVQHKVKAEAIHGNKAQNARQRALANFQDQYTRVLVATDIAARGIDVDNLEYVINFDMPNVPETYVHRIGRTGRAGAKGTAISFCDAEEKAYLKDIEKLISKKVPIVDNHPFPLLVNHPTKAPKHVRPTLNKRGNSQHPEQKHTGHSEQKHLGNNGPKPAGNNGPRHSTSNAPKHPASNGQKKWFGNPIGGK